MNNNLLKNVPDKSRDMILQVLEINQYDPTAIAFLSIREITLQGIDGVLAVVGFDPDIYIVVLNLPVVVMPVYGKILTIGDVMQLLTVVSEIPSAQFALEDNIVFFTLCRPLYSFDKEKIPAIFDSILKGTEELRVDLLAAVRHYYQIKPPDEWSYPDPDLPNIKMTPKEMQIINSVLSRCKQNVQEVFIQLMEKWYKAGYLVSTTPSTIVLDAPYGDRTFRLAVLIPGTSEGLAALQPLGYVQLPVIALSWESLRRNKGLPGEAVDGFQKAVNKISAFHVTEASAHIEMDDQFGVSSANALIKAMKALAKSVRPDLVEEPTSSAPVTPDNIQLTLASCSEHVQEIYNILIESWRAAGGTVLCSRPGRIYLRMETKAHRSGKFAQIARKFNLAVLAAPRGKKPANIGVGWGLSSSQSAAYLDCIPGDVARFEETVASLPNFERKGTITYLWMDENFQLDHAHVISKEMIRLKKAELATL
jgi:hypothetical protein